jgi:phosphoglycolate phosphatase-like HAD superfamily hydrolase
MGFSFAKNAVSASRHLPLACAEDGPTRDGIVRSAGARAVVCYGRRQFERVVLVGDGPWDVRTAHSLKLPFVGVARGQDADQLRSAGATHVVDDFLDLDQVISCLEEADLPLV